MTERDDPRDERPDDPRDDRPDDPGEHPDQEEEPQARVHVAEWTPWVWVIPVAAVIFLGWLVVRYGFFGGGDITVTFVEAHGLERYSAVRYRGAKVGTVQKITVGRDLDEVAVRISIDATMTHALREGTSFWIVEPGLEGGGLGGLLAGTYVAMEPGEGETTRQFQGLETPPVLSAPQPGKTFVLETPRLGAVSLGTPVRFEGMRAGRVLGTQYDEQRGLAYVHVFVVDRYAHFVRESTRFWTAGGISLSLEGGTVSMGDASLATILSPSVSFYTPEVLAGERAPDGTRFELHDSRGAAVAAAGGPHFTYMAYFPGPIGGLSPGTRVQMRGVQVGRVRDVRLRYVPATASLETPVTIEIDPREMGFVVTSSTTREELRNRLDDAMQNLVRNGMRARLGSTLLGTGGVELEMIAAPGTGSLQLTHDPPIIPAVGGGDGIQGALDSISRVATTIENLPLRQIAGDLRSAARRIDALAHDPRLDQSFDRLHTVLSEFEGVAVTAGENIEPIAESLRNAAESVEAAARTIETTVITTGESIDPIAQSLRRAAETAEAAASRAEQLLGTSVRQNYDVAELIRELTRAAEAVRALASYLTENPDALLKGRAD
jgi:paraquat-inducible protein B